MITENIIHILNNHGLLINHLNLKLDNKWHAVKLIDNKTNKSGSYLYYVDTQILLIKNFKTGQSFKFFVGDKEVKTNYNLKAQIKKLEFQQKQQHFEKSLDNSKIFKKLEKLPKSNLNYLMKKHVLNFGCRFDEDVLVVPFVNSRNYIRTLQFIYPDGKKRFMGESELKGNYHLLEYVSQDYYGYIYLGEGYATMATVQQLLKKPCVVAATLNNLEPALLSLKQRFPAAKFVLIADNDGFSVNKITNKIHNYGLDMALTLAKKYNCKVIFDDSQENIKSDINDYYIKHGKQKSIDLLFQQFKNFSIEKLEQYLFNGEDSVFEQANESRVRPSYSDSAT